MRRARRADGYGVVAVVVCFSYLVVAVAVSAWVFVDSRRYDLTRSRVARSSATWAVGTLLWLPVFAPLYVATRARRARKGTVPPAPGRRREPSDRYEWIAFGILLTPFCLGVLLLDRYRPGLGLALVFAASLRPALARKLRGGPIRPNRI